jgi:hypothetical protein
MSQSISQKINHIIKRILGITRTLSNISATQDVILKSNGWDRKYTPVCFTIIGPSRYNDNFFILSNNESSANVILTHDIYLKSQVSPNTFVKSNTPLIFKPNVKIYVYLQQNDNILQSVFKNITELNANLDDSYKLVCEIGNHKHILNVPNIATPTELNFSYISVNVDISHNLQSNFIQNI